MWEAQYGDFINGAQVIVDEFIASGRAKWGQTPALVLLLPHGYEGAGPDHSSARLERFLTLTAENNMRVANPTTPAQFFHLLRRQAKLLESDPLPLIVMTPKSLLRHPMVMSSMRELAEGRWQPILSDPRAEEAPDTIQRLFLCSGKVYFDLIASDHEQHPGSDRARRADRALPLLTWRPCWTACPLEESSGCRKNRTWARGRSSRRAYVT